MIRVSQIAVAPVKGMALQHPSEVMLAEHGVTEDRRFHLIDVDERRTGVLETPALVQVVAGYDATTERLALRFPDGNVVEAAVVLGAAVTSDFWGRPVAGRVLEGPWAGALSEFAGRPLQLVKPDRPGEGVDRGRGAVSLISTESLRALARAAGVDEVDGRRFRMLFTVAGCASAHQEDEWLGRETRVGDALVRFHGAVARCAITTRDPDTGARDLDTLRLIREYRGFSINAEGKKEFDFGIYGEVVEPGTVRVGDEVAPV